MLSRIVEGNALLCILASRAKLSPPEEGLAQRSVSLQKESQVLRTLRKAKELLPQLARCFEISPRDVKGPQPVQHREELRGLSHLLTQLARPGVGFSHFRGGKAFGGYQRRAQSDVQCEFLLSALAGVGQGWEEL